MIRINLLAGRPHVKPRFGGIDLGQRVTAVCVVILLMTVAFMGWRFWSLRERSALLAAELTAAQQERQQLASALETLATLEERQTQLRARVDLVAQLQQGRTRAVRMLDQITRSLPDGLWLSELRQTDDGVVVLRGQGLALSSLSDFVANLEESGQVSPPVEIIDSQTEETPQGEVIRFELRAAFDE